MNYNSFKKKFKRNGVSIKTLCFFLVILFSICFLNTFVNADTVSELKKEINERNSAIAEIEAEIEEYKKKLNEAGQRKDTLENAIETLDISRRKISANISLTQNKIDATSVEIKELEKKIGGKKEEISYNKKVLSKAIRSMNAIESETLVEAFLGYEKISNFWDKIESLRKFQIFLEKEVTNLKNLKENLEENKKKIEEKQKELITLRRDLYERKQSLDIAKQEKDDLLKETQNKESAYQEIITQKKKRKDIFEQELQNFEAQLEIAIDPTKIPSTKNGILRWPLDSIYITQYFGNTPFATKNPQVYPGNGHNGVDFRASIGTPVKSTLIGKVTATGNTDEACYGASYGKWILIDHKNGLSTLYAHLSRISVIKGSNIAGGQTIGYSGNTGYSTGPHLHFGLYATEGVRVRDLKSRACVGAIYTLPVADTEAYLNPMSYLPIY